MRRRSLDTLMRLAQREIDARQEALGALAAQRMALEAQDRALGEALAAERASVADATAFGAFAAGVRLKRQGLEPKRREIERAEAQLREAVAEAFRELKKLERLAELAAAAEAKAHARAEAAHMDDIAARRTPRR